MAAPKPEWVICRITGRNGWEGVSMGMETNEDCLNAEGEETNSSDWRVVEDVEELAAFLGSEDVLASLEEVMKARKARKARKAELSKFDG